MRYAQGGGLTDAGRAAREQIRLQAVVRFEAGEKNREIAAALRVSERSVERWRRAWREGGEVGVLSQGSPGRSRLSETQIARLERELERGPLVHGWADQRWTLTRIKTLIGRLFHVSYTIEGTWRVLKRHGWSWQQPARRAIERDDDAVEVWKKEIWPRVRGPRRSAVPGSSLRTRPGSRWLRRVPGPGVGSGRHQL
ncbi:winged helix-turn-helix domain-containing protein [Streptomyces sp. NPDC056291]|uniref:winged helix-turn-helix domain-containing protein n=1 Tax=Streptomyces sp. NPDC056291 TaxID=3345772 RepID=UPI0035E10CEB